MAAPRVVAVRRDAFAPRLAAIAVAALAVRVAYALLVERDAAHEGDITFYRVAAALMADGHGYAAPYEFLIKGVIVQTAEHPPLWPAVLALMDWLGADDIAVQRLAGCVAGTATVVLAGLVGRRVAGDAAGLLAAGLAAVHPVLIGSDGSLMSESLYGALVALVLLLAYRLYERPGARRAAFLGAAAALAALTRAEGALLLALLLIPLVRRAPRAALAAVLAAVLVVGPWTLRNWAAFDRPVLISTNDSTVLAGANCDLTYRGRFTGFWLDQCRPPAESDNEAEIAAQFRSQGLEYAADHAGRLPAVVGVRLLRTWGFWQPGLMARESEGRNARFEQIGTAFHWLLLPIAVAGLVLLRRAGRVPVWPLVAPAVLVSVTTAVGFGYPRFRHAADIAIVVLAAAALAQLKRISARAEN